MDRLRAETLRAAAHDRPVLVTGEPGSGKSLVARALHAQGSRADQPSIVVACQTFPDSLLEIELFGCAKGSVAGSSYDRKGALERACGGTLILENIEAMSARIQASLERFLESGRVHPVGTFGPGTPVDTRIVATSMHPPGPSVSDPRHHAPLWRRLHGDVLPVPNLRARSTDIPLLTQFFVSGDDHGSRRVMFSTAAMGALCAYTWPGNVTQLRSVVERLAERSGPEIRPTDLPVGIRPRTARVMASRPESVGEQLLTRVQVSGASFWSSVYPLFMKREITRTDVRDLVRRALLLANGKDDDLMRVLNMPCSDRGKFARFLRKYGCELAPNP